MATRRKKTKKVVARKRVSFTKAEAGDIAILATDEYLMELGNLLREAGALPVQQDEIMDDVEYAFGRFMHELEHAIVASGKE